MPSLEERVNDLLAEAINADAPHGGQSQWATYLQTEQRRGERLFYEFGPNREDLECCEACREVVEATEGGVPAAALFATIIRAADRHDLDPTVEQGHPLPHEGSIYCTQRVVEAPDKSAGDLLQEIEEDYGIRIEIDFEFS